MGLSGRKSKKIDTATHWKLELMERFMFRAELSTSHPPRTDFMPGWEVVMADVQAEEGSQLKWPKSKVTNQKRACN